MTTPRAATPQLELVQALRAVAAGLVVWCHAEEFVHEAAPLRSAVQPTTLHRWSERGAFGVDIFFVVSGIVMVLSSEKLFGRSGVRLGFLRQRMTRIYPPWWLYATATVALVLLSGRAIAAPYLAQSYLLLPVLNAEGKLRPILGLGWTLTYELYFYGIFAACLGLARNRALITITVTLAVVAGLARLLQLGGAWGVFLSDFIVLEFAAGAWIASRRELMGRLPAWAGALSIVAGVGLFCLAPTAVSDWRFVLWGIPAVLIVFGVLAFELRGANRAVRSVPVTLTALGDASYSMYLLHPVLFTVLIAINSRKPWVGSLPPDIAVALSVGLALLVTYPCYRLLELPLTKLARRAWPAPKRPA